MQESRLFKIMKHNRKTITGREVFLGQNGEYVHGQFDHFGLNVLSYSWLFFPWFAKMETQTLRYLERAGEVAITTLTLYLLCKNLGLTYFNVFSRVNFMRGRDQSHGSDN